ncbi:hypothetical protein BHE74_00022940 [Ensete ventricosum]|nr:hypothetical protein BHE74_00022940 [Ensete ventricosum]
MEIDGGGDEEGDCDGGGRSPAGDGGFTGGWAGVATDGAGDGTGRWCLCGSETAPEKVNNATTINDRKMSFAGEAMGNCSTSCEATKDGSRASVLATAVEGALTSCEQRRANQSDVLISMQ